MGRVGVEADPALAAVRRAVRDALDTPASTCARGPFGRIERRNPPLASGAVLVACSGGADSLALADATLHVAGRRGLAVHAAVVDHGLQDGSAEVAAAAAATLRGLGVDTRVVAVPVTGPGGPEAAARRARYDALADVAARLDAPVLLGHTLDDQAETVLLGLGRGSGARSLAGMARWDPPWLRPLLGVRRATTRAACAARGLTPWEDPHNTDPRYTRVRLRHEVLPLLEDVLAGGVAAALARTAAQLAEDDAALDAVAADVARAAVCAPEADDGGALDVEVLAAVPAAVRRRVLRGWLAAAGATALTDAHLRDVDALVGAWRGQGAPPVPGGLVVVRRHGRLRVRPSRGPGSG